MMHTNVLTIPDETPCRHQRQPPLVLQIFGLRPLRQGNQALSSYCSECSRRSCTPRESRRVTKETDSQERRLHTPATRRKKTESTSRGHLPLRRLNLDLHRVILTANSLS